VAIVEQHERWQSSRYQETDKEITYVANFVVRCDAITDRLIVAASASILPRRKITTVVAKGRLLVCRETVGQPVGDSPLLFEFTSTFTNNLQDDAQFEDPLARRPEVRWGSATGQEPKYTDADGLVIRNSSSETFDPPLEFPVSDPVLFYADNVADYDPTLAIELQDAVNSGPFSVPTGANRGTRSVSRAQARVQIYGAASGFENGVAYMRREIELHFRREGWNPRHVRDEGYVKLVSGKQVVITDDNGNPKNTPTLLDGKGNPLAPGANAVYIDVKGFLEAPLNVLNLRFP